MTRVMDVEGHEDRSFLADPLFNKPEGYVEEVRPGLWLVRGRTRGYECRNREVTCSCPHHVNRLFQGERCRHLTRLFDHFDEVGLVPCPMCEEDEHCRWCGRRGVLTRDEYEAALEYRAFGHRAEGIEQRETTSSDPLPYAPCPMPPAEAEEEKLVHGMSEGQLREMFR